MIGASFNSTKTHLQDLFVRTEELLRRIEPAIARSLMREPELFRAGVVAELYDKWPEYWDAEESLQEAAL